MNFTINAKIVVAMSAVGENGDLRPPPGATADRSRHRRTGLRHRCRRLGAATKPIINVPDEATDEVHTDDVERVVVAEFVLQARRRVRTDRRRRSRSTSAPTTLTEPQDGVMATSPATMPEAAPSEVALPSRIRSREQPGQHRRGGCDGGGRSSSNRPCRLTQVAEPALKPYQPNHSRPAPSMTNGRLCGRIGVVGQPLRRPRTMASTRPAAPALM